jgi:hypothetical protein
VKHTRKLQQNAAPAAMHEAGHYMVARVLGFDTGEIYINVDLKGADGGSIIYPHKSLETLGEVCEYLERRIQVLCAGALAQHLAR